MFAIILTTITVLLFGLAFFTKRRFGVLGLGLAAGALLAGTWATWLSSVLTSQGVMIEGLTNDSLASLILILLPALILLVGGPTYSKPVPAVFGALGFAVMGLLLCLSSISGNIDASGNAKEVLEFGTKYQPGLVAVGVAIAVVDMFLAHGSKLHTGKKHSKH